MSHATEPTATALRAWPSDSLTRVPYWVYQDPEVLRAEQRHIYEGPVWNFLCLETEISSAGDYRTTHIGLMPVVVTRDADGEIYAFENRCAHRGALICLEDGGNEREFQCVYHAWRYDRRGNLKGVAFQKGVHGKGGMPPSFCLDDHGPRKLRTTRLCGLVFGTLSEDTPPIEEYIGPEVLGRLKRVLRKPVQIIGRFTQALPNNWKLYFENVKDTYHASLLHTFFTTFRVTRLSQGGGVIVSETGAHHVSATMAPASTTDPAYSAEVLRSNKENYRLADPSLLDSEDEFGDGIQLQILSVFPGFIVQQIRNCLAVRQILPTDVEHTDLNWTYIGFADDTPELRRMRVKQSNLVGPAGFVSMEDGTVGNFVHRGAAAAADEVSVIEMGGERAETQDTRATEASVRGFWKAWRSFMNI